jgi:DNA sulfur modification protein DndE
MSVNEPAPLQPDQIAPAQFRSTEEADSRLRRLKDILGFGNHNIPARLAIARSLSVPEVPPFPAGDAGMVIRGQNLFGTGTDAAVWVSLLTEHAGRAPKDIPELQGWVRAHWARGATMLASLLEEANGDSDEVWRLLAETALPKGNGDGFGRPNRELDLDDGTVAAFDIPLGEVAKDAISGDHISWTVNAPGGSPHAAFMGGVGSGKTRTAAFMLRTIRERSNVPIVAFDFKGDMSDSRNRLHEAFGATVLTPPDQPIPLDVFSLVDRSPNEIVKAAQRLRDSLSNLKETRFGDNQKRRLGDALEQALRSHAPCRLSDVRDALQQVYAAQNAREDGAVNALVDLCRLPLFEPTLSPKEFFKRSWIITLRADVPDLFRVSIVTLLTDALDRHLNARTDAPTDELGNRALRVLCVIDEAHKILGARLPGLSNLIRQGRSKGGAVTLISQRPDDFEGEDDDFLSEMGLLVCFGTNAKEAAVRRILGTGANLSVLKAGEAWAKMRGEAGARRVVAWR